MVNPFSTTTTSTWFSRFFKSLFGMILGVFIIILSFYLIFMNEGRSVHRLQTLQIGARLSVPFSSNRLDSAMDQSLIHISGLATTKNLLNDTLWGVSENVLKLRRNVDMYQWQQKKSSTTTKNSVGSETKTTSYSYDKVWSNQWIDSSTFNNPQGHDNPMTMPYESKSFVAQNINIGVFTLTQPFVDQMNDFKSMPLSQSNYDAMDASLSNEFTLHDGYYYKGDPADPQVGDIKINYQQITPFEVSVMGKQDGNKVTTFVTKDGEIHLLQNGIVSAKTMLAVAQQQNEKITWLIRLGLFISMWVGLLFIFAPIRIFADLIPFMGGLVALGITFISALLSLALTLIAIAISWFVFRPLIGVVLIVFSLVCFFITYKRIRNKKSPSSR